MPGLRIIHPLLFEEGNDHSATFFFAARFALVAAAIFCVFADGKWDDNLLPLCSQIFRRDIRASSELTQAEAVKALGFLKQKATEQKVAA